EVLFHTPHSHWPGRCKTAHVAALRQRPFDAFQCPSLFVQGWHAIPQKFSEKLDVVVGLIFHNHLPIGYRGFASTAPSRETASPQWLHARYRAISRSRHRCNRGRSEAPESVRRPE